MIEIASPRSPGRLQGQAVSLPFPVLDPAEFPSLLHGLLQNGLLQNGLVQNGLLQRSTAAAQNGTDNRAGNGTGDGIGDGTGNRAGTGSSYISGISGANWLRTAQSEESAAGIEILGPGEASTAKGKAAKGPATRTTARRTAKEQSEPQNLPLTTPLALHLESFAIRTAASALPIPTDSAPVRTPALPSTSAPSGDSPASGVAPSPARNLAFALKLTWQPAAASGEAAPRPDAIAPPASSHPSQARSRNDQLSEASGSEVSEISEAPVRPPEPAKISPGAPHSIVQKSETMETPGGIHSGNAAAAGPESGPAAGGRPWPTPESSSHWSADPESSVSPAELEPPAPVPANLTPAVEEKSLAGPADQPLKRPMTRPAAAPAEPEAQAASPVRRDESDTRPLLPATMPGTAAKERRGDDSPGQKDAGPEPANGEIALKNTTPPAEKTPGAPTAAREHPAPAAEIVISGQSSGSMPRTPSKEPAVEPAAKPPAPPEPPSATHSPEVREVSVRFAGTAAGPVDVQFADRAGKVQVAVRTADQDLAKTLQGNLGDLVGRLEEKGFKTEAWTPAAALPGSFAGREIQAASSGQNHRDSSGSPGGGQPDSQTGQQESGQRQSGRWRSQFQEALVMPDLTAEASD